MLLYDSHEGISEINIPECRKKIGDIVNRLKMFQLSVPGEVLPVNNIGNSLMHYMSGMYPLQKMAGGS